MSYLGVKFNGVRKKIAGMPIMDVAFSSTSTNGVQNKVIKAKFDEVDTSITGKANTLVRERYKYLNQQTNSDGSYNGYNFTESKPGYHAVMWDLGWTYANVLFLSLQGVQTSGNSITGNIFGRAVPTVAQPFEIQLYVLWEKD